MNVGYRESIENITTLESRSRCRASVSILSRTDGESQPPDLASYRRLTLFVALVNAVSYTHLTLPTTPYV